MSTAAMMVDEMEWKEVVLRVVLKVVLKVETTVVLKDAKTVE